MAKSGRGGLGDGLKESVFFKHIQFIYIHICVNVLYLYLGFFAQYMYNEYFLIYVYNYICVENICHDFDKWEC